MGIARTASNIKYIYIFGPRRNKHSKSESGLDVVAGIGTNVGIAGNGRALLQGCFYMLGAVLIHTYVFQYIVPYELNNVATLNLRIANISSRTTTISVAISTRVTIGAS